MTSEEIFARLWRQYIQDNPDAAKIHRLLSDLGETVVNDHIALRTYNDKRVSIDVLAQPFIKNGYRECGQYDFPVKKLFAKHYEHEAPNFPKVFISELLLEKFSTDLVRTVNGALDQIPEALLSSEELLFSGAPWSPLSYDTYKALLTESEYAAWMYAYGFRANHFTVNVNALKSFQEVSELNDFLIGKGFALNSAGGYIKGTPADCLEQSSTLAEDRNMMFGNEEHAIPSCYYEFAKRYPLPNGKLFNGFVAASADKIFESTDTKK
jgi:hypothetical protein